MYYWQVVSALASCKPIVTCDWVEAAVKCLTDEKPFPKTDSYLPNLVDANLGSMQVSFQPDYKRGELFQDKVFYFVDTEQVGLLGCANFQVGGMESNFRGVEAGGGGETNTCPPSMYVVT